MVIHNPGRKHFGYDKFSIIGHDRGAVRAAQSSGILEFLDNRSPRLQRIAHRMAADWPNEVVKIMLLDIAPTYDLIERIGPEFALTYWHWFFLAQPYPFPESMSKRERYPIPSSH